MATTVTRSNAEILRLFKRQWEDFELYAVLVDASGAGTPPTAASSVNTWLTYALLDLSGAWIEGFPGIIVNTSTWTYDSVDGRAESPTLTWNFDDVISTDFSEFSSTTVTHIVICDWFDTTVPGTAPPFFVLEESPSLTLTSSSTLSRSLQLFGKEA
jgi:hypothetical protein